MLITFLVLNALANARGDDDWLQDKVKFSASYHPLTSAFLHRTFDNKSISFLGDSTSRKFYVGLTIALSLGESLDGLSMVDYSTAIKEDDDGFFWKHHTYVNQLGSSRLEFDTLDQIKTAPGEFEKQNFQDPEFLNASLQRMVASDPDVLMFNYGLHLLHFTGYGRDMMHASGSSMWTHYEDALDTVFALTSTVPLVVFKTNNPICDSKYTGRFSQAAAMYTCQDAEVDSKLSRLYSKCEKINSHDYCVHAPFNRCGVNLLNDRLVKFVSDKMKTVNRSVAILDEGSLYSDACNYTEEADGRHYTFAKGAGLRLLTNIVSSAFQEKGGE